MDHGVIGGVGLTHLKVYEDRLAPDGVMSGCAHVHAVTEEAYYAVAGTGFLELHDLEHGFRRIPMKPGTYVHFSPGTIHRAVSTGGLEALVIIGNAGLVLLAPYLELFFEELDYPDASFDRAFGACVLHHVDIPRAVKELGRVLAPGGSAVFVENSARNPLLMLARRRLVGRLGIPRYGDDHEHPLRRSDFDAMRAAFDGSVTVHYPDFVAFRLLDFYVLRRRVPLLSRLLRGADRLCQRIPWVREFSYFLVVQFDRAGTPACPADQQTRRETDA